MKKDIDFKKVKKNIKKMSDKKSSNTAGDFAFSKENILDVDAKNYNDVFYSVASKAKQLQIISDENALVKALCDREEEDSTNLDQGFALPHARIDSILRTSIFIVRSKNKIKWGKSPVSLAIVILVPKKSEATHMSILATISSALLDSQFVAMIETGNDKQKITNKINILFSNSSEENNNNNPKNKNETDKVLKIVGVTKCPVGIAHTFMAAKLLEQKGKELGYKIKIEKQASEGIIDELSQKDIEEADLVIISAAISVNMDRFSGKRVYQEKISTTIKDPAKTILTAKEKATIYSGPGIKQGSFIDRQRKATKSSKILGPLQNGVSFMIPFVVTGGILLAIAFGIGSYHDPISGKLIFRNSFFNVLSQIGGSVAFVLMVPILGGYIAYQIGDRAALAPAMITSFIANFSPKGDGSNPLFFNYWIGDFGLDSAQLGFFGAIIAGFACGYLVKYIRKITVPDWVRPIMPIIIIPIVVTMIVWAILAFVIAIPISKLTTGLSDGVKYLISHNFLWIAAIFLGAMIAFDMGGPINKIAFMIGVYSIGEGNPQVMGMVAAAIAVPPLGCALSVLLAKLFRSHQIYDAADYQAGIAAFALGIMGITEGAIPFAVKYPKIIIANVVGGAVAAVVASLFMITDMAGHGGVIVYLLGAVGHAKDGVVQTDYLYGILYLLAIIAGTVVTGFLAFVFVKQRYTKKEKEANKIEINNNGLKSANNEIPTAKLTPQHKFDNRILKSNKIVQTRIIY